MRCCQIPGCKNKAVKTYKKDGIFLGVHLENVVIWTCEEHAHITNDVNAALQVAGEDEASNLQHEVNPFLDVTKICPHKA